MQEKDELKKILQQYAFEETSQGFDDAVMKRIVVPVTKEKPLLNALILKLLAGLFLLSILLLVTYLIVPENNKHFDIGIDLNNNLYKQLFSFLLVFWIMMIANILWNKHMERMQTV